MATVWPFYKQRFGATKQFGTSAVFRLKMCSCDFDVGHVVYSGHVNLVYFAVQMLQWTCQLGLSCRTDGSSFFVRISAPGRVRRVDFLLIGWKLNGCTFSCHQCPCEGRSCLGPAETGLDLASYLLHFSVFILLWSCGTFGVAFTF